MLNYLSVCKYECMFIYGRLDACSDVTLNINIERYYFQMI